MKQENNLLVAHGGGPTAVINASLRGVIEQSLKSPQIGGIYGACHGVEGIFTESFADLRRLTKQQIEALSITPASVLGSCRRKITDDDIPVLLGTFRKHNIRYFLYNGGNDSMDTCNKIAAAAEREHYEMQVIGIPKTIDNDLMTTDHCPGFGSAARYVAVSTAELARDVRALPIHVCVMEVMGRNAGWLTAAAALAGGPGEGADLIYLPETPFDTQRFLQDASELFKQGRGVLVVVSEGIRDESGRMIGDTGLTDGFGHTVPGGAAQSLAAMLISEMGINARSEKPGLLGRSCIAHQSPVDEAEARMVGQFAVAQAVQGETGKMASLRRVPGMPYRCEPHLVPLKDVAAYERLFPKEWIPSLSTGACGDFADYCLPLIGDPLPTFAGQLYLEGYNAISVYQS